MVSGDMVPLAVGLRSTIAGGCSSPQKYVGGWPTPLKNDGVKVSWDDEIPNIWEVINFMFQTTNHYRYPSPYTVGSFRILVGTART
jgi:hypothetical protein